MSRAAREQALCALEECRAGGDGLESVALATELGVEHGVLVDEVLKSLVARDAARLAAFDHVRWELSEEGTAAAADGSPEFAAYTFLASTGNSASKEAFEKALGIARANRGLQQALKRRWIAIDKATKAYTLTDRPAHAEPVEDDIAAALNALVAVAGDEVESGVGTDLLKQLKSRKLATARPYKTYRVYPGEKIADARAVQATELTKEMLDSGEWKSVVFKDYNFAADGKSTDGGYLHTLLKVREQFRGIFLEMGFEEMPTNNYVESSFWNFDTLFQPQQHPARDEHDTFFMSDPELANLPDPEYVALVKKTHEVGGFGSRGYRYDWSEAESRKNILRTHTTAVSSRMLYKLAKETGAAGGDFQPRKYFSIDRVFRNETLDATHLAEFHQIEGLVADRNLSLGHLKGIIHEFFKKMGMDKLRFKPTHNPYTCPSLEIHSYHEGLGKWVEVGNSGMFRPEMLQPMGLPEDVTVIAWGLSLERPTMISTGVNNIRDLFGHKVDIAGVQRNPICRMTL
jgi:phenylalanyl-tRNA synthetase alpha chain